MAAISNVKLIRIPRKKETADSVAHCHADSVPSSALTRSKTAENKEHAVVRSYCQLLPHSQPSAFY
jgi:hypothetical protein